MLRIKSFEKSIYIGLFALVFLAVSLPASASSDLAGIWTERMNPRSSSFGAIDTEAMAPLAKFFVYFVFALLAVSAIAFIFVGRIKMILAGSNEDDYDSAKYTFITGIVTFLVSIVIYVSLDYIMMLVETWSSRIA